MQRYIPGRVTDAVKQGFSAPDASWFKGESIDYVRETLYRPRARIFDYLDRSKTLALVDEHLRGQHNRRLLIWSLLNLEEWLAVFTGEGVTT
jgi:asparagine synthase (glutamine-hydrolysing)